MRATQKHWNIVIGAALFAVVFSLAQSVTAEPPKDQRRQERGAKPSAQFDPERLRATPCQQQGFTCGSGMTCTPVGENEAGLFIAYQCSINNCDRCGGCAPGSASSNGSYQCQPQPKACADLIHLGF